MMAVLLAWKNVAIITWPYYPMVVRRGSTVILFIYKHCYVNDYFLFSTEDWLCKNNYLKAWATYLFKPQNIAYKHSCDYSKLIEYAKSTSYSDGSYFW